MKIDLFEISGLSYSFIPSFIKYLNESGVSVENPISGRISVSSHNGELISLSFFSELNLEDHNGIQLWIDNCHDIFFSWEDKIAGVRIFMDGVSPDRVIALSRLCFIFVSEYSINEISAVDFKLTSQDEFVI